MSRRGRSRLRSRLLMLAVLEPVNAVFLPAVAFWYFGAPRTMANLVPTVAAVILLLVGGFYWWQKVRQLDSRSPLPRHMGFFSASRLPLLALVLVGVVACAGGVVTGQRVSHWFSGAVFGVLAVLEYVNYFHIQLSHDNAADLRRLFRSGLHRSALSRDLEAHRRGRA